MNIRFFLLSVLLFLLQSGSAQIVWSSSKGTTTFTKPGFADWTQAANQDRISDSVWITRASNQSLFNIRKESAYGTNSPSGTMWAFGTTDSISKLSYKTFVSLSSNSPQSLIGKNLVLHLVAENIYLDIKFLSYGSGSNGADFSYVRATGTLTSYKEQHSLQTSFALEQNYPNPFNPSTVISYQLPINNHVTLKVYDAIGREVATLVNEVKEAGYYSATFDGSKLSSGMYFARLQSGDNIQLKKMLLLK